MKKKLTNNPFKYYFAGTQIAIIVFSATLIGYKLDSLLNNNQHVIMITFATLSISYALYALIKDVNKEK